MKFSTLLRLLCLILHSLSWWKAWVSQGMEIESISRKRWKEFHRKFWFIVIKKMQKCHASSMSLVFSVTYLAFGRRVVQFITNLSLRASIHCLSLPSWRNLVTCLLIRQNQEIIEEPRSPFAVEGYLKGTHSLVYSALCLALKQGCFCGKAVVIHRSFFSKLRGW